MIKRLWRWIRRTDEIEHLKFLVENFSSPELVEARIADGSMDATIKSGQLALLLGETFMDLLESHKAVNCLECRVICKRTNQQILATYQRVPNGKTPMELCEEWKQKYHLLLDQVSKEPA